MIGFKRTSDNPYKISIVHIPIDQVMLHERTMPSSFISESKNVVTDEFIQWCTPLIGPIQRNFISFKD